MKKILFYTLFISPVILFAQVDRTKAPQPGAAPDIKIGTPATFTLPNGLKVFVVRNTKLPRVSATLTIDIEAIVEGNKAGIEGMAGQLLRRGTIKMKKAQLDEAIDFLGASVSTSSTSVSCFSLTNNFTKTFSLMADVALRPSFSSVELEKIRKQNLSALAQAKDDPETIAENVKNKLVYGKTHPYGEIETETTVKNITVADIKKYYTTYWKPNIAYLIFVGDITVEQAKKLATTYFGTWQKGVVSKPVYKTPTPAAKTFIALVDRPASVQSVIYLVAPIQLKPGTQDVIASRVTANLLGGGASARLYKNLREKYGFTYGAYSSISSDKLIGNFTANASVRNEKTDSAVGQFLYEFNKLRNELPAQEEVSLIKNEVSGSFARSLEDPATIANFALNVARYHLPADYYQNYLKNVATVDTQKVKEIADKYIPVNNLTIVIVGNAKEISKGLEKYGEVKYFDIDGNEVKAPTNKAVAASVTAESIFNKCIDAYGGKDAIAVIKDIEVKGTVSISGQTLNLLQKYIIPGGFYQNISMGPVSLMKQYAKNGTYYTAQGGTEQPLQDDDKEELDEESYFFTEILYLKNNYTATVKAIEQVEGKDAYAVEIKSPKGRIFTNYYDAESLLKVKTSTTEDAGPMGKIVVSNIIKEYKVFNGVKMPVKILLDQGPLKLNIEVADVKVNQGLKPEDIK
jgi:predicted Zn-dependent peptidase